MSKFKNAKWLLVFYDTIILTIVNFSIMYLLNFEKDHIFYTTIIYHIISLGVITLSRIFGKIYQQIWRYGGVQCYIKLMLADLVAFIICFVIVLILNITHIIQAFPIITMICVASTNLLFSLFIRLTYRYAFKCGYRNTLFGRSLRFALKVFGRVDLKKEIKNDPKKIKIAIIGAGTTGVMLAEELLNNINSSYLPVCFIDQNKEKAGREIHNLPVFLEGETAIQELNKREVVEVVIAISNIGIQDRKAIYDQYQKNGFKVKVYDFPLMESASKKRSLREFDIEELLFRKQIVINTDKTYEYYKNKTILITGGGGSIGSELCRQLAKMETKQIIILDIYENGAYDVQQELKITYGNKVNLKIEICSITNEKALRKVFEKYHPEIVINAAAHKHVPLMEDNCVEAVENNVFGTKLLVDLCEEYHAKRFMMVSTDKAVNPTNVMGATKRMCEMIVQSASTNGNVKYSATRFGNVLGSAGSVIPLFRKQIASGGPLTITDKRIIRYFMTIPEASQLVLESGAMANNGELFVLDMGQPIKILDLAESMIKLSGAKNIEIIETGLRPGEKLYEELLIKTEELIKTENKLIFIEKDNPLSSVEIFKKLNLLRKACETNDDNLVRNTLKEVVPTYKSPVEVNEHAMESQEIKLNEVVA